MTSRRIGLAGLRQTFYNGDMTRSDCLESAKLVRRDLAAVRKDDAGFARTASEGDLCGQQVLPYAPCSRVRLPHERGA